MTSLPSLLRVPAKSIPSATMIIIHGLGDQGESWRFLADIFHQSPNFQHINFIFPNAQMKPLSLQGGMPTFSWFDMFELGAPTPGLKQDVDGYFNSVDQMKLLINKEIESGIPADRIMIGGFSQGAAVSLGVIATFETKLSSVLCLSGFMPVQEQIIKAKLKTTNLETPIFHGHGDLDPVIPIEYANSTRDFYKSLGFKKYEFHEYLGNVHSTSDEELHDIIQFVKKILPAENKK